MEPYKKDGAFVIVEDPGKRILTVRVAYGAQKIQLPGGGIDRSELPDNAATNELVEEAGLLASTEDLELLAVLGQQRAVWEGRTIPISGFVFLFRCLRHVGELRKGPDSEILRCDYMSVEEMLAQYDAGEVGRGSMRMAVIFDNIRRGIITRLPYMALLADPVAVFPSRVV